MARQNMLTQVGSITDNGAQQFGIACASSFGCSTASPRPTWPQHRARSPARRRDTIPLASSVRVFSKDYANPRIYTTNVAFEQELASDVSLYLDFTHAKGCPPDAVLQLRPDGFLPDAWATFLSPAPLANRSIVVSRLG